MRLSRSLRGRLLLSHLAVTLVGVGLVAGFAGRTLAVARLAEAEHSLEDIGFLLSGKLEEPLEQFMEDKDGAETALRAILIQSTGRDHPQLAVITADGRLISGANLELPTAGDPRQTVEVRGAFEGRDLHDVRPDETGREMLYAAVPIEHEGQIHGVLRLATPMAPVREAIARTLVTLGVVVLIVALLLSGVGWWLAGGVAHPIAHLTEAAGRLAGGHLDEPVPDSGPDELVRLARAFNNMAEQLTATLNEQRAFVANASHELRTPLTSVKLRVEALREGAWKDPEIGQQFLAEIEGEVDRLARIANDLLDLSRIESGLDRHAPEPVDMVILAEEARDAFSVRAGRAGVTLTLKVEGSPPPAAGNETHLRRLLDNLLDNAIKHTPSAGRVTVRVTPATLNGADGVALEVRDTGTGIPPEHLAHIFERFYRVEHARSRDGYQREGSGLGLSIVHSIVRTHGGEVTAASEPGQGTAIHVVLPAMAD